MARFLLAVWPYTGHVHPNLALAHALRARGHEVAFYTGAMARPAVEREGFTYFPFKQVALRIAKVVGHPDTDRQGIWDSAQLYERLAEHYTTAFDQSVFTRGRRLREMYRDWILGTVPQQVADLEAVLAEWRPDLLVCDPFMWGPILILHETGATPVAVFSYFAACLLPGPDVPPFAWGLPRPRNGWTRSLAQLLETGKNLLFAEVRRGADRARQGYGLRPLPAPVMEFSARVPLYLIASATEFDYERRDLPASVHYVGACLWDKPRHEPPPAWLNQLTPEGPVVYVTEGTAHVPAPILLRAAAQGLANLPMQVVMTTGQHRDPATLDLGLLAPNIRVTRWVPHSDLFPKASVVVTHGGSGTVLSALHAGLPVVAVPMQWDQIENAHRVVDAGAGVRLTPRHCTPESLREAVERVLAGPSFQQKAQRLAAALKRGGGAERAAKLLEDLIAR